MSRTSNTFYAPVANPPSGSLEQIAQDMAAGSFAAIPCSSSAYPMFTTPQPPKTANAASIWTYGGKIVYDRTHRKVHAAGGTHAATGDGDVEFFCSYDCVTGQWTKTAVCPNGISNPGPYAGNHDFESLTCNRLTGDLYRRHYGGGTVYKLAWANVLAGQVQEQYWTQPTSFSAGNITSAFDWWPSLNGGAGGLIECSQGVSHWTGSDFLFSSGGTVSVPDTAGHYQEVGCTTQNYFYFGGGAVASPGGSEYNWFRITPAGLVTELGATPYKVGIGDGVADRGMIAAHPNNVDVVLIPAYLNGTIYIYRTALQTFQTITTVNAGQSPFYSVVQTSNDSGTQFGRCTLYDYEMGGAGKGAILICHCNGDGRIPAGTVNGVAVSGMCLYKPPA